MLNPWNAVSRQFSSLPVFSAIRQTIWIYHPNSKFSIYLQHRPCGQAFNSGPNNCRFAHCYCYCRCAYWYVGLLCAQRVWRGRGGGGDDGGRRRAADRHRVLGGATRGQHRLRGGAPPAPRRARLRTSERGGEYLRGGTSHGGGGGGGGGLCWQDESSNIYMLLLNRVKMVSNWCYPFPT